MGGGPKAPVIVSTAIAGLLAEVLAAEVPEVARGDVVIKSVARVSGKMSKVAVARREGVEKVFDPVLACVGVENSRLRAIRERLGGEVSTDSHLVKGAARGHGRRGSLPAAVHRW